MLRQGVVALLCVGIFRTHISFLGALVYFLRDAATVLLIGSALLAKHTILRNRSCWPLFWLFIQPTRIPRGRASEIIGQVV